MATIRVGIVGGGIVGVALARQVAGLGRDVAVTVLEKEPELARHQTGRNSGVVHAGLYYTPGSLKARLCRRGVGLLSEFCAANGLTYDRCGKVVVALDQTELARLEAIGDSGRSPGGWPTTRPPAGPGSAPGWPSGASARTAPGSRSTPGERGCASTRW